MRPTIYSKMIAGFLLIIVAMIVLAVYLLYELQHTTSSIHTTLGINVASVERARELRGLLVEQERAAQKFLVSRDSAYFALFTEATRRLTSGMDSLSLVLGNAAEGGFLQRFHLINEGLYRGLSGVNRSVLGTEAPAGNLLAVSDSIEVMRRLLDDVIQQNQALIVTRVVADDQRAAKAFQFAAVLTLGSVLITVLFAFLLARMITNPIRVLQAGVYRVAQGSFQPLRVTSRDELADLTKAFNDMGEKLRRSNEQRAEMMQRIVHELRTPLQSLHSVHYLLSEQIAGPLNEQQQKYVEMLRVNAERITGFTNQFLDLAKFEAGRMQFRQEPTKVHALVEKAVDNARVHAEAHQITISMHAQDDLPELQVDPEKIGQVMSNLLSNAVKYTPDGGQIEVAVEREESGVRMLVKDSGVGIDPEDIPHLFTKFYQAKNAGKARTKGTGIGLALVKAIVDGHGGKLHVESEVGKGSMFCVELPLSARAGAKKNSDRVRS
jgi:signal transduction histidine kinase